MELKKTKKTFTLFQGKLLTLHRPVEGNRNAIFVVRTGHRIRVPLCRHAFEVSAFRFNRLPFCVVDGCEIFGKLIKLYLRGNYRWRH